MKICIDEIYSNKNMYTLSQLQTSYQQDFLKYNRKQHTIINETLKFLYN